MRNHDANTMNIWFGSHRITMAICNGISLPVVAAAVSCSLNDKKSSKIRDGRRITTKANIIALFVNYLNSTSSYKQNNDQQTTRCQPKLHLAVFTCNKWHPILAMFTFISNNLSAFQFGFFSLSLFLRSKGAIKRY